MKLLLSGASHKDAPQMDLTKSLGGLISSTPVPNGRINSLFSDISNHTIQNKTVEIVAIFLKNDSSDANNFSIKQIYENDNICEFEWGVVSVSDSGSMEIIGNRYEEPFYVEWFEPNEKIQIKQTFASGEVLGLWIKRKIKDDLPESECVPIKDLKAVNSETLEVIFEWD